MQDRIRLIERRDVDELIILDVSSIAPRFEEVRKLTDPLFCPVTVGGGVGSVDDIRRLLASGADKVAIKSAAFRPGFVKEASDKFGAQAIVVSLEVRGGTVMGRPAAEVAVEMENLGAGEILLTSVERDGTMQGYDLDLIRSVSAATSIPVVAAGGCGSYEHMMQAIKAGADAVASGAMFQFCEATPKGAARHLKAEGYETRT